MIIHTLVRRDNCDPAFRCFKHDKVSSPGCVHAHVLQVAQLHLFGYGCACFVGREREENALANTAKESARWCDGAAEQQDILYVFFFQDGEGKGCRCDSWAYTYQMVSSDWVVGRSECGCQWYGTVSVDDRYDERGGWGETEAGERNQ